MEGAKRGESAVHAWSTEEAAGANPPIRAGPFSARPLPLAEQHAVEQQSSITNQHWSAGQKCTAADTDAHLGGSPQV